MTKISKKSAYPVKVPVRKDYFVGTDSENNGKTVNFDFESTAKLINELNGTPILNYLFKTDENIPLTVLTEGVFLSEGNQTTLSSISKLYINKKNFNEDNMSDLFRFISMNREVFVMKLRNSSNLANGVYFKITGATEFAEHFVLNVAIDLANVAFTQLINFNVYFFDFELKSSDLAITLPEFNKIVTQTGFASTASSITFNPAWSWLIKNVSYTNPLSVTKTIVPATTGKKRIDVFVLDTLNSFQTISGSETTGSPIKPSIPTNSLEVTFCIVGDSGIETVSPINLVDYATIVYVDTKDNALGVRITALENKPVVDISNKVDKVTAKSLLLDTEIARLATLSNYTHPTNHPPSIITQDTGNRFVTDTEKSTWNAKQENLVSGTNIKTINGNSLLGSGNITLVTDISGKEDVANKSSSFTVSSITTYPNTKALVDGLATKATGTGTVSGANTGDETTATIQSKRPLKTIEGQSLEGSGNIDLTKSDVGLANVDNTTDLLKPISTATQNALNAKQNTLVSGTNIRTINGNSLLGSTDLVISAGTGTVTSVTGANGVTVVTGTTTPVIGLGAITPTSIVASGTVNGSNLSGTNTGDNATNTQYSSLVSNATHTGDATGSSVLTLATVNANVGSFGTASSVPQYIVNAKGLTTASANVPIVIAQSQVTNLISDLASKITGTGTTNFLLKFTGVGTVGNSIVSDDGTTVMISKTGNASLSILTNTSGNPSLFLTAGGSDGASIIYDRATSELRMSNSGTTNALRINSAGAATFSSTVGTSGIILPSAPAYYNIGSNVAGSAISFGVNSGTFDRDLHLGQTNNSGIFFPAVTLINQTGVLKINSLAGTGTRSVVADASGNLSAVASVDSRPYKVYTALLSQSGTTAPVATVLENTLGGTVVLSRTSGGAFSCGFTNAFVSGKTTVTLSTGTNVGGSEILNNRAYYTNTNTVTFASYDNGVPTDGRLSQAVLEIRVYN